MQYSLQALTSWVTELNDPNLVLILLGDEQPASPISRPGANHDVLISIVAHDPSVFRQIASWHWQDGLLPSPSAPLEPMDAFRNQFLGAFSTVSSQAASAQDPQHPDSRGERGLEALTSSPVALALTLPGTGGRACARLAAVDASEHVVHRPAAAVLRLTQEHRDVLRICSGICCTAAHALGIAPGTVKSRTYYALHALRLAIEELRDVE